MRFVLQMKTMVYTYVICAPNEDHGATRFLREEEVEASFCYVKDLADAIVSAKAGLH